MKGVVSLSLFLTASSVTSLADQVFQWKGFILTGIEFYRTWVTGWLRKLGSLFGVSYSASDVDQIVLIWILSVSVIRIILMDEGPIRRKLYRVFASVGLVSIAVGVFLWPGDPAPWWMLLGMLPMYVGSGFCLSWFSLDRRRVLWVFFTPGAFAVSVVLLLGAINSGLSRQVV